MKDEANIFQKMMSLAIKNDSLEKELRLTKDLISKGVLDSHSYILGFNDGKQSSRDEIEALKSEIVSIEKNTDYWADKANWIKNNEPVAYVSTTGLNDIEWTDKSHLLNYGDALYTHPVKELHLSLQKSQDGELLAVTYTDDEHRIVEVLWEKPPVKELTLTDEEILKLADETCLTAWIAINPIMDIEKQKEIAKQKMIDFAEAILRKAQEQ